MQQESPRESAAADADCSDDGCAKDEQMTTRDVTREKTPRDFHLHTNRLFTIPLTLSLSLSDPPLTLTLLATHALPSQSTQPLDSILRSIWCRGQQSLSSRRSWRSSRSSRRRMQSHHFPPFLSRLIITLLRPAPADKNSRAALILVKESRIRGCLRLFLRFIDGNSAAAEALLRVTTSLLASTRELTRRRRCSQTLAP